MAPPGLPSPPLGAERVGVRWGCLSTRAVAGLFEDHAGVEDAFGVERGLEPAHEGDLLG